VTPLVSPALDDTDGPNERLCEIGKLEAQPTENVHGDKTRAAWVASVRQVGSVS